VQVTQCDVCGAITTATTTYSLDIKVPGMTQVKHVDLDANCVARLSFQQVANFALTGQKPS
jgi:hypothetical protein